MDHKMEGHNDGQTVQCIDLENHSCWEERSLKDINQQSNQQRKEISNKSLRAKLRGLASREESKTRWSMEENFFLVRLYSVYGARWSTIAGFFNDRSEFSVKNHFYYLKKRMSAAEQTMIHQELKYNREKRFLLLPDSQAISSEEKMDEEAIVDSFFADHLDCKITKKINGRHEELSLNASNGTKSDRFYRERLSMLKRFIEIIEDQIAIKKAKVSEI